MLAVWSGFFSGTMRNNSQDTGNFEEIGLAWKSAWGVFINKLKGSGANRVLSNRELARLETGNKICKSASTTP